MDQQYAFLSLFGHKRNSYRVSIADPLHLTIVLNVPDPEKPETWTFQLLCTWAEDDASSLENQQSRLNEVKARHSVFADPFGCANAWIPEGTPVSFSKVTYWEPIPWDNHGGKISLAGDAAHPMTFRT